MQSRRPYGRRVQTKRPSLYETPKRRILESIPAGSSMSGQRFEPLLLLCNTQLWRESFIDSRPPVG